MYEFERKVGADRVFLCGGEGLKGNFAGTEMFLIVRNDEVGSEINIQFLEFNNPNPKNIGSLKPEELCVISIDDKMAIFAESASARDSMVQCTFVFRT